MSRLTQVPASPRFRISPTGLSPAAAALSRGVRLSFHSALSAGPTTPARRRHRAGLGSCAFARRYSRNHFCFLFLRVLRCFSSPGWRPAWQGGTHGVPGCPIRTSADLWVFAPPRGFSQLVASFVASESQGILHAPFSPFLFPLFGKVAFYRASRYSVPGRASLFRISTEGSCSIALEFFFSLLVFLSFARAALRGASTLCVFAVLTQLPACQCALSRCLFRVVPGRVELPTSTLSV